MGFDVPLLVANGTFINPTGLGGSRASLGSETLRTARRAGVRDASQIANASGREQPERLFRCLESSLDVVEVRIPGVREPVDELPALPGGRFQQPSPCLLASSG